MNKTVNEKNIERFSGFANVYNNSRPTPPKIITDTVSLYLKSPPETVVDIGSGTGLSTLIWKDVANAVIGIEPNDDMRNEAEKSITSENISLRKGLSNETGMPNESADVVSVSQAFHWFDIDSTLEEIYRVLKPDGVLAIFDCDFPPAVNWQVENAYRELHRQADSICFSQTQPAVRNDKSSYIDRLNVFGRFRFVKEVVCHSTERCTPERMIGIALSQGGVQTALRLDSAFRDCVDGFSETVRRLLCGEFDIVFSYRLRVGVK